MCLVCLLMDGVRVRRELPNVGEKNFHMELMCDSLEDSRDYEGEAEAVKVGAVLCLSIMQQCPCTRC